MKKIKYTPEGFSYIDISLIQCLNWGGFGICGFCGMRKEKLKLIFVVHDTYCEDCFNEWLERCKSYTKEDIEYDLKFQKHFHINWYKSHGVL